MRLFLSFKMTPLDFTNILYIAIDSDKFLTRSIGKVGLSKGCKLTSLPVGKRLTARHKQMKKISHNPKPKLGESLPRTETVEDHFNPR